jgi:hypothetical protein
LQLTSGAFADAEYSRTACQRRRSQTKGPLEYDAGRQELISREAKLAYPIRDGIPIMLPEEARRLD